MTVAICCIVVRSLPPCGNTVTVDTLIFADEQGPDAATRYDGASLFLDLIRGTPVEAECHSVEGTTHRNTFELSAVGFARFYIYNASLPAGAEKKEGH